MKKFMIVVCMMLLSVSAIFADDETGGGYSRFHYASKDVLELAFGAGINSDITRHQKNLYIYLTPGINYFFMDYYFVGTNSNFEYRFERKGRDDHSFIFGPSILIGRSFRLARKVFFNLSAEIAYAYTYSYRSKDAHVFTPLLNTSVKYDIGGAVLFVGISHIFTEYVLYPWDENGFKAFRYSMRLVVGYSLYF